MIWLVLALIGAGTFFVTGFNLLTDPLCVSADFGGGRVVQVTCRSDEFGTLTGLQAGLISIFIGLGILVLLFWRPLKSIYTQNKLMKIQNSDYNFQKVDEVSQESTIKDSLKKCPKCAEDIKVEAVKCRFCGSDLGPRGVEKSTQIVGNFTKKYLNSNYSFQIMAIALVTLGVLIFGSLNISKTRELNALNKMGQFCVTTEDGTGEYGCADYPNIKFEVCTPYEFIRWAVRAQEFTFLVDDASISQGQKTSLCSDARFPYLFSIDSSLEDTTRVGVHSIWGSRYGSLSDSDYAEGGIYSLVAKVNIKPKS